MVAGSESTARNAMPALRLPRQIASVTAFGAALLLAACEVPANGPLSYQPPEADAATTVSLGSDTLDNAVAAVSGRLAAAGVTVLSAGKSSGLIRARANSMAFLDCGQITQRSQKTTARFPGNSERAVLVAADFPAGLVLRELSAKNSFDIQIVPRDVVTANISQSHELRGSTGTVDRSELLWRVRQVVSDNSVVTFPDQTKCTSSDAIATIIRG